METKTSKYFVEIIEKVQTFFTNVDYEIDKTPSRSILKLTANFSHYRVFITELISDEHRKYNYYLLDENYVVVGFDNSQDVRAIKIKFGKTPKNKSARLVPQCHLKNKTILELTKEANIDDFIYWIKINIKKHKI